MGRASILVDKDELLQQIQEAEAIKLFSNWSSLFDYVANTTWGKTRTNSIGKPSPLNAAVVYNRVKEFNLFPFISTQKGTNGVNKGERPVRNNELHKRVALYQRKECEAYSKSGMWGGKEASLIKKKRMDKYIDKLEAGSLKAGIALKCIDCCAGDIDEVRQCTLVDCPLYSISPLTRKL